MKISYSASNFHLLILATINEPCLNQQLLRLKMMISTIFLPTFTSLHDVIRKCFSSLFISMNTWILLLFIGLCLYSQYLFWCSIFSASGRWISLSCALWHISFILKTCSFFFGPGKCSMPILLVCCPIPEISHFSKESCFFLVGEWCLETKIWILMCANYYWGITAPSPFQWKEGFLPSLPLPLSLHVRAHTRTHTQPPTDFLPFHICIFLFLEWEHGLLTSLYFLISSILKCVQNGHATKK